MKRPVLILGARSAIGIAIARRFAELGHPIQLAARFAHSLGAEAEYLRNRYGVAVNCVEFDVLEYGDGILSRLPTMPQIVICVVGRLHPPDLGGSNAAAVALTVRTNFEGPACVLSDIARLFVGAGGGIIVGISSVAGERGRSSNYIYGAAKAGFTAFLSGLRASVARSGVRVVTVLPGYVRTPMTAGASLPALLTAEPMEVADAIHRAVIHKKDVVYVRPIWRIIMMMVRLIPESIFKWSKF